MPQTPQFRPGSRVLHGVVRHYERSAVLRTSFLILWWQRVLPKELDEKVAKLQFSRTQYGVGNSVVHKLMDANLLFSVANFPFAIPLLLSSSRSPRLTRSLGDRVFGTGNSHFGVDGQMAAVVLRYLGKRRFVSWFSSL